MVVPIVPKVFRAVTPEELASLLADWVNGQHGSSRDAERFVQALAQAHNTLQQSVIRFIATALAHYEEATMLAGGNDERNAGARQLSSQFRQLLRSGKLNVAMPVI